MVEHEDLTGQVIAGKYRLDRPIGQGGFGSVYVGEHLAMQRRVAIKVISMDHAKVQQQDGVERFSREARLVSQLQSPHTVSVFDYGVEGRRLYLVMEYIGGETLKELVVKEQRLVPERAAGLTIQILKSLEEAHHRGILHRDLKPANIMVSRDFRGEEQLKVLDFGIAKVMNPVTAKGKGEVDLTENTGFIGTPRYAAPEQLFNQKLSAATDVYGVGLLLWEMLMGVPALSVASWGECSRFHIANEGEPQRMPGGHGVSKGLVMIVERAAMRYARDRWASALQMREMLERWLANPEGPLVGSASLSGEEFWAKASQNVDPNLEGNAIYFGEESVMEEGDSFGVLIQEPQPVRQPERMRVASTLEQADWAQSASHILGPRGGESPGREGKLVEAYEPVVSGSQREGDAARGSRARGGLARWKIVVSASVVCAVMALGGYVVCSGEERAPGEVSEPVLELAAPSFEVPEGRFSSEGIWLAVQMAKWKRTSSVETIDLQNVRQYTAFYERGGVTCEITMVEAKSEMALHELISNVREPTSVIRFDYRAVKLHPVKGAGMLEEVDALTRHLKDYRRLVIQEQENQKESLSP